MIHFVLVKSNSFTIKYYKIKHGLEVGDKINIILYEEISKLDQLPCQALIFCDFERLSSEQLELVCNISKEIREKHPTLAIYNDPCRFVSRFQLLRKLYEEGLNVFNAYRLDEPRETIRYPVFLREENEHTGTLTPLLKTNREIDTHTVFLKLLGYDSSSLIIVEYCDISSEDGQFHKYSGFRIGDRFLPKILDLDSQWMVKSGRSLEFKERFFKDLTSFVEQNPHKAWLQKVFHHANIEYGRADYGMLGNRPQLWEINSNPSFGGVSRRRKEKEKQLGPDFHAIMTRYRKIKEPTHESIRAGYREMNQREVIVLDLKSCRGIDSMMKPDRRRDMMRKIHMWMGTNLTPYKEIIKIYRFLLWSFVRFLSLLKLI